MTDTEPEAPPEEGTAPDEATASPDEPPAPAPGRQRLGLAALAAVFFVGAVVLALVAAGLSSDLRRERRDRRQVELTASRFATAFLTWDPQQADKLKAQVESLATGKVRREYEQAFSGLRELITATKNQSTVVVKDVFSTSIESGGASAVVVLDQTVEGVSGRRQNLDLYVQLDLVKQGSVWRVDNVTNLNFAQSLGGAAPGATATTVPQTPPG